MIGVDIMATSLHACTRDKLLGYKTKGGGELLPYCSSAMSVMIFMVAHAPPGGLIVGLIVVLKAREFTSASEYANSIPSVLDSCREVI